MHGGPATRLGRIAGLLATTRIFLTRANPYSATDITCVHPLVRRRLAGEMATCHIGSGDKPRDFIVRIGGNMLRLESPGGKPFDLTRVLREMEQATSQTRLTNHGNRPSRPCPGAARTSIACRSG
jgi:hypothetical protein